MVESSLDCDANNIGGDDENAVDVSSSSLAAAVAAEAELVVVAVADANADAEQVGVDAIVMDDNPAILPPNDNTTSAAILGEGGEGGELALAAPALPATPARHAHASWAADSLTAAPSSSSSSLRTTSSLLRPLAADLSAYFATLSKTVLRRTTTTIVAGDTTHAAASTTSTITTSTASSSSIAVILWEGVGPILAAGQHDNINVMSCDSSSSSNTTFADDGGGILSIDEGEQTSISRLITPQQAALYLYTVAQNIVALESAVLGTFSNVLASNAAAAVAAAADGGTMGGTTAMKTIMANQVAEIVSAVTVAATYCTPRSIILQSGILPALAHLIESTANVPSKFGSGSCWHSYTPFHPEFLNLSLLAGQYHYASSFLSYHPTSHTTLEFPYLPMDPTCYLRTHYLAGLVHVGCNNWNAALDSFHLCLTMPCSTVSKIATAARKKSLLVQCLLLEWEELDESTTTTSTSGASATAKMVVRASSSADVVAEGGGSKQSKKVENRVLELPGAASAAICKYMSASSNRVVGGNGDGGGGGSAPERTGTGSSEPSKQQSFRKERSSRRRTRGGGGGSSSNSLLDEARSDRGEEGGGSASSKNSSHLGSYHDLVSTYISGNIRHYAKLLSEMTNLLHVDGNWELAKQLESRLLIYRSIRKVGSVYSVLGLDALEAKMQHAASGVGEVLGNRGLEDVLMGMAACDAKDPLVVDPFFARIDQSTSMVAFLDDDDDAVDDWLDADLSARLQSCMALAERVRDLDIAFTTSPKYLQHSVKEMMTKGDLSASTAMLRQHGQQGGSSVADIGHGTMDMGMDW